MSNDKCKCCCLSIVKCNNNLIIYKVGDKIVKHPMAGLMEKYFGNHGLDKMFWDVGGKIIPMPELLLQMRRDIEQELRESTWVDQFREIVVEAPSDQMLQLQIDQLKNKLGNANA